MASDIELATRIQSGDQQALALLYARYLPVVWRYAFAKLRREEAAARDAVSETFLAAIRAIHTLDVSKGSVAAWLMGIARHKIADAQRQRRTSSQETPDSPDPLGHDDPAQRLADDETRTAVAAIIADMEDDQRLVLEWKYLDNIPVSEIAERLGRTYKSAEALLYRAREQFRERCRLLPDLKGEIK